MRFMDILPINFLITAEHLTANLSLWCKVHASERDYKGPTFDRGAQMRYTGPFSARVFPFSRNARRIIPDFRY